MNDRYVVEVLRPRQDLRIRPEVTEMWQGYGTYGTEDEARSAAARMSGAGYPIRIKHCEWSARIIYESNVVS